MMNAAKRASKSIQAQQTSGYPPIPRKLEWFLDTATEDGQRSIEYIGFLQDGIIDHLRALGYTVVPMAQEFHHRITW